MKMFIACFPQIKTVWLIPIFRVAFVNDRKWEENMFEAAVRYIFDNIFHFTLRCFPWLVYSSLVPIGQIGIFSYEQIVIRKNTRFYLSAKKSWHFHILSQEMFLIVTDIGSEIVIIEKYHLWTWLSVSHSLMHSSSSSHTHSFHQEWFLPKLQQYSLVKIFFKDTYILLCDCQCICLLQKNSLIV